jgi:hypothetical protein
LRGKGVAPRRPHIGGTCSASCRGESGKGLQRAPGCDGDSGVAGVGSRPASVPSERCLGAVSEPEVGSDAGDMSERPPLLRLRPACTHDGTTRRDGDDDGGSCACCGTRLLPPSSSLTADEGPDGACCTPRTSVTLSSSCNTRGSREWPSTASLSHLTADASTGTAPKIVSWSNAAAAATPPTPLLYPPVLRGGAGRPTSARAAPPSLDG